MNQDAERWTSGHLSFSLRNKTIAQLNTLFSPILENQGYWPMLIRCLCVMSRGVELAYCG